jgi:hypothetical protein
MFLQQKRVVTGWPGAVMREVKEVQSFIQVFVGFGARLLNRHAPFLRTRIPGLMPVAVVITYGLSLPTGDPAFRH